jgi:hypothetical protein
MVDPELLPERPGGQQTLDRRPEARSVADPALHRQGDEAGRAAVVEAVAPRPIRLEEADSPVPVLARGLGQRTAQLGIDLPRAPGSAAAEQVEEGLEIESADARPLELEQVVLAGVDVHGQDVRAGERVVEGVAARAGDDEHPVGGLQAQRLVVHRRVLPALVVDQVLPVHGVEQPA